MNLTSLKISHMGGPQNMITSSGNTSVPLPCEWRALCQHQNGLIDIDDNPTDADKIDEPFFLRLGSVLYMQK